MELGKYKINRSDTKRVKSAKKKLKYIEDSIASCWLRGFSTKKLIDARAYYISEIKK